MTVDKWFEYWIKNIVCDLAFTPIALKKGVKKYKERRKLSKIEGFRTGKDKNETRHRRFAQCGKEYFI